MTTSMVGKVTAGFKVVGQRARVYRRHFGPVKGWVYAWRDRPGATGTMAVDYRDYPPILVRRGDTDLRTLCHVLCEEGYEFPWALPSDPRWIIDAGANSGMAAVYFAHKHPSAKIIAIEPDPSNFDLLERNTAAFPNVVCLKAALWTHEGSVDLVDPGNGSWAFQVSDAPEAGMPKSVVDSVTVDSLVDRFDIDRVHLFKVDIEGGEKTVFAQADSWIDRVDAIAIELHDWMLPGCADVFDKATSEFGKRGLRGEDTFVVR